MRFSIFRHLLLVIMSLIAGACIGLSVFVQTAFDHRSGVILMVSVEAITLLQTFASANHKFLFGKSQAVALDFAAAVLLLPFSAILFLFILDVELDTKNDALLNALLALQILVIANTSMIAGYALSLGFIALITACFFDPGVWQRDIDSTPSPFPIRYVFCRLFLFLFPCLSSGEGITQSTPESGSDHSPELCLPGCDCGSKPSMTQITSNEIEHSENTVSSSQDQNSGKSSMSLSRSLVRLPDEVERRTSIAISFEV
ncbi:uncharacterized protein EV420DRAFT_1538115 [Desarmillaria tabescens]|uniref:Uncharacterized protein n=1 Tax=Armillaria tabescens TaxID=1929756 RepID=A0AA39KHN3_ARMTA|nr:uncharacterized protein EV420DRAFT_1538115 [Desarmillaria tabescens]KAK0459058.1 hypothetical protein EV420DRAFT_1538115 [Desarmillaria tabescens]